MSKDSLNKFLVYLSEHKKLNCKSAEKNRRKNPGPFDELGGLLCDWAEKFLGEGFEKTLSTGYSTFVSDVNRSQIRYEKSGNFSDKNYEEVYEEVYGNSDYMNLYHWGVYASTFLWEHHLRIYEYFKNDFIGLLREKKSSSNILDLGTGSGIWGMLLLNLLPEWRLTGVDISSQSIDLAESMAAKTGLDDRIDFVCSDALKFEPEKDFDAGISCFLMEHLENSVDLLRKLSASIKTGSFAFITAALAAAETDHISEFKRESEIVLMAEEAGFRVLSCLSASPSGYPEDYKFLPRSMALVMQKRKNDIW